MPGPSRQQLIDLLDRQLFQGIYDSNPDRFPEFRRAEFARIKAEVAGIAAGVHDSVSAEQVVERFHLACDRAVAEGFDAVLADLGVPNFAEARYHFDFLAGELDVIHS